MGNRVEDKRVMENRRTFLKQTGGAALFAITSITGYAGKQESGDLTHTKKTIEGLKISQVLEHFFEHGSKWMDYTGKWDGIHIGNPEKKVDRCLVTWMASSKALRYMVEHQFDLIICHEPFLWLGRSSLALNLVR